MIESEVLKEIMNFCLINSAYLENSMANGARRSAQRPNAL